MSDSLIKSQDIILNKTNHICKKLGLNNIMAQLYAILYFSDHALSLNDMVERLKISKGSASVNIRALERYGAVRRVWVKGSRKDYYEAETDIANIVMERIRAMVTGRLSEIDNMITSSHEVLDSTKPQNSEEEESIKVFKERLERLGKLYGQARSILELFNSDFLKEMLSSKQGPNKK